MATFSNEEFYFWHESVQKLKLILSNDNKNKFWSKEKNSTEQYKSSVEETGGQCIQSMFAEELSLENTSLTVGCKQNYPLIQSVTLSPLYWIFASVPDWEGIFQLQDCLLYKHSWKDSLKSNLSVNLLVGF